jgi:hypothetical protein
MSLISHCKYFETLSWAPNLSPLTFIQIQASYERFEAHSWVTHLIFNSSTSPMIFVYSLLLGICSPRWIRFSKSHQGCGWSRKVCIVFSFLGDLIVETELDLGDRSEWIRVESDPSLCELHNGDVGILYGWLNFRKKSCVFVSVILIYFLFLFKFCSCLA